MEWYRYILLSVNAATGKADFFEVPELGKTPTLFLFMLSITSPLPPPTTHHCAPIPSCPRGKGRGSLQSHSCSLYLGYRRSRLIWEQRQQQAGSSSLPCPPGCSLLAWEQGKGKRTHPCCHCCCCCFWPSLAPCAAQFQWGARTALNPSPTSHASTGDSGDQDSDEQGVKAGGDMREGEERGGEEICQ